MTESEAKGFIQGKLDCMKKCSIFNKEDNVSDKDCDNCDYCYSQGNFGEQKNAFEMAIKALEEVQQYRSTGVDNMRKRTKVLLLILGFVLAVTFGFMLFIAFLTFFIGWAALG